VIASRRTISREAGIEGVGLHLGKTCRLVFRPAAAGAGITFIRTDRGGHRMPATADVAVLADRRTQLGEGDDALHTVEHVLAAVRVRSSMTWISSWMVRNLPSLTVARSPFWRR
jgi:UDP-3-O-[3-hydroxymyristoyl] N-acetylglucosamine deacetylase/3-hydroxyacyl-[acyl-carrier-protein] dehydratase